MTLPARPDRGASAAAALDVDALRPAVLGWFRANARPLAFRGTSDPWAILVSEFMAQQTQAARAAEAWLTFIAAYPTPVAFAAASPADALRAWRGLGYNRRALALLRTARVLVEAHGGHVPEEVAALERLPGVGPYTARAVASLAFGLPVGAVDTNVRRVLGRALFDSTPLARDVQAAADALVPADSPGAWTHALMDVGATFCRPRSPRCAACPVRPWCRHAAATAASDAVEPRPATARGRARGRGRSAEPFQSTTRWLRGRILGRLLDADAGSWVAFDRPIGGHGAAAIATALRAMARDGLVEVRGDVRGDSPPEGRLPTAR